MFTEYPYDDLSESAFGGVYSPYRAGSYSPYRGWNTREYAGNHSRAYELYEDRNDRYDYDYEYYPSSSVGDLDYF